MLQGLNQNQNEALNGVLWSKCPKIKFSGKRKVNLAVCDTICQLNVGSASKAELLETFGIKPGSKTGLRKTDADRIENSASKISIESRRAPRKCSSEKKNKSSTSNTISYYPGAFGLSCEPEIDFSQKNQNQTGQLNKQTKKGKRKPATKKQFPKNCSISVTFVDETNIKMLFIT